MIEIVAALAKVEVEDVDRINLLHLVVHLAYLDMFGDGFRHSVEHSLEEIKLSRELHLDDYYFSLVILGLDIDTVILVAGTLLIALALKQFLYLHNLACKNCYQSFQHGEVGLVAQHSLHCPVKTYVLVVHFHRRVFITMLQKYKDFLKRQNNFGIFLPKVYIAIKEDFICVLQLPLIVRELFGECFSGRLC